VTGSLHGEHLAQIFHPRFGLFLRLGLLALAALAAVAILAWRDATGAPHAIGEAVEQPVPFSHKHHVGEIGIDCRYCHDDVERAATAGVPAVAVCMTCHSQLFDDAPMLQPVRDAWRGKATLAWNRVDDLPDFVYFNHSIHIAKGVGCETCHGRVDRMPLTWRAHSLSMRWCLRCHRAPENYLRPRSKVFAMGWHADDQATLGKALMQRYGIDRRRLEDCSTCHR
jgi:Cytochrome c7 and related cytochrome c/Class III cytochrome C family